MESFKSLVKRWYFAVLLTAITFPGIWTTFHSPWATTIGGLIAGLLSFTVD